MARHWLAQRVGTREWLSRDLDIDGEPEEELSGAGSLRLTIEPEIAGLETADGAPMFDRWGTYVHVEDDGIIRWSGLVIDTYWEDSKHIVELAGFSAYPHGMVYTSKFSAVNVDPAVVVKHIWEHLQTPEDGRIQVEVVGTTTARIGTETKEQDKLDAAGEPILDADKKRVREIVPVPYELNWFDNPDCGREIDQLTVEGAFEWVESHRWNDDKSDVLHRITIADRFGRQRNDLTFEQGVNVVKPVPFDADGDDYASEVHGVGAGEGEKSLRASAGRVDRRRLRRAKALFAKDVISQSRLEAITRAELSHSEGGPEVTQITVINHPHAPFGSWALGDSIRVDANVPWLGRQSVWQRVVATRHVSATTAVLTLTPV